MTGRAISAAFLVLAAAGAIAAAPNHRRATPAVGEASSDQPTAAQSQPGDGKLVHLGPDGKLVYQPHDAQGDEIPDFSNCGYGGGGIKIPDVPVKLTLGPVAGIGDDTLRVQHAIEQLSAMPLDADGFRGTLLLIRRISRATRPAAHAAGLRSEVEKADAGSGASTRGVAHLE